MELQVTDYIDVTKKAEEFGYNLPTGIAILPINFDTATSSEELLDADTAPTIRSLWRQAGVTETRLENSGTKFPQAAKKSAEWVSPIIFISQAMLTNAALPLTINMISSYLYDLFKGRHNKAQVNISFVSEQTVEISNGEEKKFLLFNFRGTPNEWESFNVDKLKHLLEKKTE